MAQRNSMPVQFSPSGVADAIDSTNVREGVMAALTNLIPDPTTRNVWQCRPASVKLVDFNSSGPFSSGFSSGFQHGLFSGTSGFISCLIVIGTRAYGLINQQQFGTGNLDAPFSFNLLTNSFDVITGITTANIPQSQPSSGAWTPPSLDLVGGKLIFTSPGFNFAGGFAFGVLDISNVQAPTWTAQNTTTNPLPALPTWVANFNGRAYFLVNIPNSQPGAYFTDVLSLNITNANQVITFDDTQLLTCAKGLGLFNQLGGVVQSLIVFKNTANVYQITGDAALSNLARNSLNVATGTAAPNSVTPTPEGLIFLAPDGLRLIDFDARVSPPIGVDGDGVNLPFLNPVVVTRVNAACNQNVLRIYVQNSNAVGSPNQDWWYDLSRKKWSGPHTFPGSMIGAFNDTFIIAPVGVLATIFRSDCVQNPSSTFVENGQQLTFLYLTAFLPDPKIMAELMVTESSIKLATAAAQGSIAVAALDQNSAVLDFLTVSGTGSVTEWGQFNWGQANWGSTLSSYQTFPLEWTQPLVFSRMQVQVSGNAGQGFKIGDYFSRMCQLGYVQRYAGAR